jgi:hypothetical protein
VITPYKGRNKPEPQKEANRAHARLRGPGEQANVQLKTWCILRKLRCCPAAPVDRPKPSTCYRTTRSPPDKKAQCMANAAHAAQRAPGGRASAALKSWRILRKQRCCPRRATALVQAVQALVLAGRAPLNGLAVARVSRAATAAPAA